MPMPPKAIRRRWVTRSIRPKPRAGTPHLRNRPRESCPIFLAPFRGVSKWYQAPYAAVFEWVYSTKRITGQFVRALLGLRVVTNPST